MTPARLLLTTGLLAALLTAAPAGDADPAESVSSFPWFQEIAAPPPGAALADVVLTPATFTGARDDLGDLRLYDAAGREVPYALRVRRREDRADPVPAREFNKATRPDRAVEVTLDLGDAHVESSALDVSSPGHDFRRPLRLDGSDDTQTWSTLLDRAYLVHFETPVKVDHRRLDYPPSRFRYLRVRIGPDPSLPDDAPTLDKVQVLRRLRTEGEYVAVPAPLGPREPVRGQGAPGSAWLLTFPGGDATYVETLRCDVADPEFARPYQVERIAEKDVGLPVGLRQTLSSGQWQRDPARPSAPMVADFPEVKATKLRLVVTDSRNPPLTLTAVEAVSPARQLIFRPQDLSYPLRLYHGDPRALPPRYDFAATLPADLQPPPARVTLGERHPNPDYVPPPKPWTERWPWLVYAALTLASLTLLALLTLLAREAITRHDAAH